MTPEEIAGHLEELASWSDLVLERDEEADVVYLLEDLEERLTRMAAQLRGREHGSPRQICYPMPGELDR